MKNCCLFSYSTPDEAMNRRDFEVVEDFGGEGEGYSWSDGNKTLCRCENCGALFLKYEMTFLAMTYDQDDISYVYYLPVTSRDEALQYIDMYFDTKKGSIHSKDSSYKGKKIWFNGKDWCWNM